MRSAKASRILLALLALGAAATLRAQEEPLTAGGEGVPVPKKTKHVQPVYPAEALAQGIRGIVILDLVIDARGKVASTSVLRSVAGLDEAAIAAARQWEYEPTKIDGKPVSVRLTVPITFSLALPRLTRQAGIPELRQGVTPVFPKDATNGGAASAEVTLEPDGRVGSARLLAGESPWSDALLAAVKTWRFAMPPEDAVLSFRVEVDFVKSRGTEPNVVDLRATGLQRSELLADSSTTPPPATRATTAPAPGAPAAAPPAAAPPAAAPASAAPAPTAPPAAATPAAPTATPKPPAPAPTPAPTPTPAPLPVPKTAAPAAAAASPEAPKPTPAPASGAPTSPAPKPTPAPQPATPVKAPADAGRATPPGPTATPPAGRPGASATAAVGAAAASSAPPPVEVITAPPPAPPPENGISAVREVTLEPGVPDLTRGRRPVVPPVARLSGTTGTVEVLFSVSAGGVTALQTATGPDMLRYSAEQTVSSWVFTRTRAERAYLIATFTYGPDKGTAVVKPQQQLPKGPETPAAAAAPATPPGP